MCGWCLSKVFFVWCIRGLSEVCVCVCVCDVYVRYIYYVWCKCVAYVFVCVERAVYLSNICLSYV